MDNTKALINLQIPPINKNLENKARKLIFECLSERFDIINDSLNPDLKNIVEFYLKKGDIFIVGIYEGILICSGALIKENDRTGKIVRMYVKKDYRRMGIASHIVKILENYGKQKKFTTIVLETNDDWTSAIKFYKCSGYQEFTHFEGNIHFKKKI